MRLDPIKSALRMTMTLGSARQLRRVQRHRSGRVHT